MGQEGGAAGGRPDRADQRTMVKGSAAVADIAPSATALARNR
ncbi:hypothetical protein PAI11_42430 [Patulibacter medicamentivorans]|uniref:Uncharacterized protein n=1 Tax=Patulibacter medicamentivorans TaxID=1097667 RepID=H0EBL1_9ACTN|nr:hypothetical protein PAI11_42430 [Patulibacter medicamentivorans]